MSPRISDNDVAPEAIKIMFDMEKYIKKSSINQTTRELMKIRASQINGCAYCINMHTTEARKLGETEQRIYCVNVWEECDFYSPEEKVALELTEHITLIPSKRVPDDLYNRVRKHYDNQQYTDLVLIINQINSWNRLSIAGGQRPAKI